MSVTFLWLVEVMTKATEGRGNSSLWLQRDSCLSGWRGVATSRRQQTWPGQEAKFTPFTVSTKQREKSVSYTGFFFFNFYLFIFINLLGLELESLFSQGPLLTELLFHPSSF